MSTIKNNKRKLPDILMTRTTSMFCFAQAILFFIVLIYYTIMTKEINLFAFLIVIILFLYQYYFNFRNKKIFLTEKKVYYYSRGKKILSLPLVGGFSNIGYKQPKLGKIFNYGTLKILTDQNVLFTYNYLNDGEEIYNKIIEQHTKEVRKIDPNYSMVVIKGPEDKLNKNLDSFEEKE